MSGSVLLDMARIEQAERIRQAQIERLSRNVVNANRRPSVLKSLLLALTGS